MIGSASFALKPGLSRAHRHRAQLCRRFLLACTFSVYDFSFAGLLAFYAVSVRTWAWAALRLRFRSEVSTASPLSLSRQAPCGCTEPSQ